MDIGQWLRGLGLQSYEQAFRDNGIDFDVLLRLTADDLKEIGVLAVGHRRKILDAIRELAARAPAVSVIASPITELGTASPAFKTLASALILNCTSWHRSCHI